MHYHWLNEVKNKAERDEYKGYRHILVGSDFSKFSEDALNKAVELGTPFQSKITVLHAAELLSIASFSHSAEHASPLVTSIAQSLQSPLPQDFKICIVQCFVCRYVGSRS